MIDDLFTELTVGAVDQLLSPETPREDASFGLARLNARLSPPLRSEEVKPSREALSTPESELEGRLLSNYLQLTVDDLQQISPRVHDWLLERLSNASGTWSPGAAATLRTLYFLFPESTVRHGVVGLLVQADSRGESSDTGSPPPLVSTISEAIDADEGLSPGGRVEQMRLLVDFLLDYVDLFPGATERALTALHHGHREETLTAYLLNWSSRLGGELGSRIRRAME